MSLPPVLLFGNAFVVIAIAIFLLWIPTSLGLMMWWFYRKPDVEQALVRTGAGGARVAVGHGIFVIPPLHQMEVIDLSLKRIDIHVRDLICRDNTHGEILLSFFIRINDRAEDILQVAKALGCSRASDPEELIKLFAPMFRDAVAQVAQDFTAQELPASRDDYLVRLINFLGAELNGFVLETVNINHFRPL